MLLLNIEHGEVDSYDVGEGIILLDLIILR